MKSNLNKNQSKKKSSFFPSMWKFMFVILLFASTSSFGQLLNENFEGGFPAGWTTTDNTGYPWTLVNGTSAYGNGNNAIQINFYSMNYSNGPSSEQLNTIQFAPATSNYYLMFDEAYASLLNNVDQLQINYSTDSGATFNQLDILNGGDTGPLNTGGDITSVFFYPTVSQWQTFTYSLPVGTNMIQFNGITAGGNNLFLDNVQVAQSCSGTPNAGITVSSANPPCKFTQFTLSLLGNDIGPGLSYQWQSSSDDSTWTDISGATSSFYSTSISASTYLQCVITCANSLTSSASVPYFAELPAPVALPFTMDFESNNFPDACWTQSFTSSYPWSLEANASAYGNGMHCAKLNTCSIQSGGDELSTSEFTPTGPGYVVSFDEAYASAFDSDDQLDILYSTDGGFTFNDLILLDGGDYGPLNTGGDIVITCWTPGPTNWQTLSYPLPVGTNMIQFNGISAYGNSMFIDNVSVGLASGCTGTPNAGTTQSSDNPVGQNTPFGLMLNGSDNTVGLNYQWQSSPDNITYTDIPGATNKAAMTSASADTWYQCVVTCPSGGSSVSTPLLEQSHLQYSWAQVTNPSPNNSYGQMLLLTDGTVVCKSDGGASSSGEYTGNIWDRLTPDIHGSYINGSWTSIAPMISERDAFSSQILKDGSLYVAGGEYGTDGTQAGAHSEVYNPLTNTWTATNATGQIMSDANSELLDDGTVLQAVVDHYEPTTILIYNPATNNYVTGPSTHSGQNESMWVKLPDNSILFVDEGQETSERYIPSLNTWVVDANTPTNLYDPAGFETGPGFLLPDGRAIFFGSQGNACYYTPSGSVAPGTWTVAPSIPNHRGMPDASGAMMVNGKILISVEDGPFDAGDLFTGPTYFYEFDYTTGVYTLISTPVGTNNLPTQSELTSMLCLPDGTIALALSYDYYIGASDYYVYTSTGAPLAQGKPKIANISRDSCTGYTITGTGFNGITEGGAYGDDEQMETNYPIIRMTSGSNVYYARSFNWNSTGVQRGTLPDTAHFTLPAGIPAGTYSVVVTANGNASDPINLTIGLPAQAGPIAGNPTPCNGSQTYSITPVAGATSYTWTIPALWTGTSTSNSINCNVLNVSGNVTVKANNVCGSSPLQTLPVHVSPNPAPVITANGNVEFCQGSSVTLSTTPFSSYAWSNGGVNSSIVVTTGGTYTVTVTSAGGCTGSAQKTTTEVAGPIPTIVGTGISTYCSGNPATLNVATYSSYLWSTGAITQSVVIPGNSPNTYTVTVTNGFGCTGSSSIVLSNACNIPSSLATTNVARTTAMASWLQPSCDNSYIIRISKHNQNIWTNHTITPNTHYTFSALNVNTMYDWEIETLCNASGTINSGFSAPQTFTTLAREAGDGITNPDQQFNVYPNPANDHAIVAFTTGTEDNYSIRLIDVTGRIIQSVNYTSVIGENQYQMNLSNIAKGVYTVILQNGTTLLQSKIVVQ